MTDSVEERLKRAAEILRRSIPTIEYDPVPDNADGVRVYRKGAKRWSWNRNVVPALPWLRKKHHRFVSDIIGDNPGLLTRLRMFWLVLTQDTGDSGPENSLDGGNVLVHWSEVTPFISLWTPEVAESLAKMLEIQAADYEVFGADPAAIKLADEIIKRWEGAE